MKEVVSYFAATMAKTREERVLEPVKGQYQTIDLRGIGMREVKRAKEHAHMQCPSRLLQAPFRNKTKPRATVLGLPFERDNAIVVAVVLRTLTAECYVAVDIRMLGVLVV